MNGSIMTESMAAGKATESCIDRELRLLSGQILHDMQKIDSLRKEGNSGTEDAPVVLMANRLLEYAVSLHASDIHMEPRKDGIRIRYRIDGMLRECHAPLPIKLHSLLTARLKIMAGMDINERRRPLDGHIVWRRKGKKTDFRVASMPVRNGETLSIRILDEEVMQRSIGELGMTMKNESLFRRLVHAPSGMLIVTGPMNSGKSTTLYAALRELNTEGRHIMTLEDPVEQVVDGVDQMEINEKAGLTFSTGLRATLRMDADSIMVGEIRDGDTAHIAVRAALTGHLILTTLHAKDTCSTLYRLMEIGIKPYLLAATIDGIVAQRLLRRLCPHCREKYEVRGSSQEAVMLGDSFREGMTLYRGRGCTACHGSGYSGRIAVHEILSLNDGLRAMLISRQAMDVFRREAISKGLCTIMDDGLEKAMQGITSLEEIRRTFYGS